MISTLSSCLRRLVGFFRARAQRKARRAPAVPLPPQTPFTSSGFEHLATEVYYKKTSKEGYVVCDGSGEDSSCADSRSGEFITAGLVCATNPSKCAHLTYLQPAMTIMMNGNSCAKTSVSV